MKRKMFIFIMIGMVLCVAVFYFFVKNNYKTVGFGNTSNKSAEEIKEYILNLTSYEAKISVEVTSNKSQNSYQMKQQYVVPNIFKQEVIEPASIAGLITSYDGNHLKIEHTSLNLSKIYENYPYLAENNLCLSDFIYDYQSDKNATWEEKESQIILKTKKELENRKRCNL